MNSKARTGGGLPPPDPSTQQRLCALWADILLEQETAELQAQIAAEQAAGGDPAAEAFFAERDLKFRALIRRCARKQRRRAFLTSTLPRALKAAAAVILILSLGSGIALASSPSLRVQVMKLLTTVTPAYTRIELVPDEGAAVEVPAGWQGTHFPGLIPEGMRLGVLHSDGNLHMAEYTDSSPIKKRLLFSEHGASGASHIDTENALVEEVMMNGRNMTFIQKGDALTCYWTDGIRVFMLTGKGIDKQLFDQIAFSVCPIK